MNPWRDEIERALSAFITVADLAGHPLSKSEIQVEYMAAPHKPPSSLPSSYMAVYAFWWDGAWLKVGKAGEKSQARYISQHYNPMSAGSNLAKSLINDPRMLSVVDFDPNKAGEWIKKSTCRVNILIPAQKGKELLSSLETFLHLCLRPRYEGKQEKE